MKARNFILLALFILLSMNSFAKLPETVDQSLDWELNSNSFNAHNVRGSTATFPMYHYDVPLSLLSPATYMSGLSPSIKDALIFDKDGVPTLRWIINPEDTKWHLQLAKFLESKGLDATRKQYFTGHLTASRSMYVEAPNAKDPQHPIIFSGKVSTNRTGGKWKTDKYVDESQIEDSMTSTKLAQRVLRNGNIKFTTLKLLEEPAGFIIKNKSGEGLFKKTFEQGFIVRDIGIIAKGDHYYLPGFAVLHEQTGKKIAKLNGSSNPKQFWQDNYLRPMGRAAAELSAYLGLSMTSAHNQQWLVELDKNMKPTGRIVLRDFNDSHVVRPFYQESKLPQDVALLSNFSHDKQYNKDHLLVQLGVFHATAVPSWISKNDVKEMELAFFNSFDQHFAKITGISLHELERKNATIHSPPKYSLKSYQPTMQGRNWSQGWRRYFAAGPCFRGEDFIMVDGVKKDCKQVLAEVQGKGDREGYNIETDAKDLACTLEQKGDFKTLKKLAQQYRRTLKDYLNKK